MGWEELDQTVDLKKLQKEVSEAAVTMEIVSAHNFRKKRAFFVNGATVAKKCINKSRTTRKKGRPALHFWC